MNEEDRIDLTKQRKTLERGFRKLKFSHVRLDISRRDLRNLELHAGRLGNEQNKREVIACFRTSYFRVPLMFGVEVRLCTKTCFPRFATKSRSLALQRPTRVCRCSWVSES